MALILLGHTECALCGKLIDADKPIVATTHFIADQSDPLWKYSDAPFHKECFMAWDKREEFIARFNGYMSGHSFAGGSHQHMDNEGEISFKEGGKDKDRA